MKNFFYKIFTLLFSLYILQYLLFIVGKNILDNNSNFRFTRYFRNKIHNVYILGNSRAVNSINEKYANDSLNLDVINISYNGMPFNVVESLLSDICSTQHEKIILIEITALFKNNIDNNYSYYSNNSVFFRNNYKSTIYSYLPLFTFNNEIFLRNIYYLTKNDNE